MPDITKCTNSRCIKKADCYRFTSPPSSGNQSYDIFAPDNNTEENFSCDMRMKRGEGLLNYEIREVK